MNLNIQEYIRPGMRAHLVGVGGVSMCPLAEVLLGMGLDEFSMSSASVLRVRKLVSELNYADCAAKVDEILAMSTADEVLAYLKA